MSRLISSGSFRFLQDDVVTLRTTSITSGSNTALFTQKGDDIQIEIAQDASATNQDMRDIYDNVGGGKTGWLLWDTYLEAQDEPQFVLRFTPTFPEDTSLGTTDVINLGLAFGVVGSNSGDVSDIVFQTNNANPLRFGNFKIQRDSVHGFRFDVKLSVTANLDGGFNASGPIHFSNITINVDDDATDDRTGGCSFDFMSNQVSSDNFSMLSRGSATRTLISSRTSKLFIFIGVCRLTTDAPTATVRGRFEYTVSLPRPKKPYDENFGMGIIPYVE
jgi:hypothetical protein